MKQTTLYIILTICILIILFLLAILYTKNVNMKYQSGNIKQKPMMINNNYYANNNYDDLDYYSDYNYDRYWYNPLYWWGRYNYNQNYYNHNNRYDRYDRRDRDGRDGRDGRDRIQPTQIPIPTQSPTHTQNLGIHIPTEIPLQIPNITQSSAIEAQLIPSMPPIINVRLSPPAPEDISPLPTLSSQIPIMPENIIMPTI